MSANTKFTRYQKKRDFSKTAEPSGNDKVVPSEALRFVIQKHAARNLHFDLRLEFGGVFHSWAVPKGPSLNPADRRLAMEVEDHPLDYGDFEGTIPKGQYGGGTVMLWDRGYWAPEKGFENIVRALGKGELKFVMEGERMHGSWVLVRTRRDERGRASWMLIKHRDGSAIRGDVGRPSEADKSVASGRTMAEIAAGKGRVATPFMTSSGTAAGAVWHSNRDARSQTGLIEPVKTKRGAKTKTVGKLPEFIKPQLTTPLNTPPTGPGWAHEIKFDGYRMQLRVQAGKATLKTRNGLDWSARYPEMLAVGARLPEGIYDGEVVALDETGAPNFAALQAAVSTGRTKDLVFFIFDFLFHGLTDLRSLSLSDRKTRLQNVLKDAAPNVRYVEHFVTAGDAVLQSACRMHLEGIVSKQLDSPYTSGRVGSWTKSKCRSGHEVVIGGYTTTNGAFRSLIAGINRNGKLVEIGRIGTGFSREKVATLLPKLRALETGKNTFSGKGRRKAGDVHWVRPELVAEIEYEGFTADGLLRQAAFKALREDKPAQEVKTVEPAPATTELREPTPAPLRLIAHEVGSAVVMNVTLTHAGKTMWPDAPR